jgi:hypothetical protein
MSYSTVIPDFTYRASSLFVISLCMRNPASETTFIKDFRVHHFEKFAKLIENQLAPLLIKLLLFLCLQRNIQIPIICVVYGQFLVM